LDEDFFPCGRCAFPDFLAAFFADVADLLATFFVAGLATFFVADLGDFLAGTVAGFLAVLLVVSVAFFSGLVEGAFFATAFLAAPTFPTTTTEPMDGKIVDSSPPDHVTRSRTPLTPVTTPSRGAWPTRVEGT